MEFAERKLGALEASLDVCHGKGLEIYVQVFRLRCRRTITEDQLRDATSSWIRRHPLLHATVDVRSDGRYFVPIPLSKVSEVVHWHQGVVDWIELAEEKMQQPLKADGSPLWQLHFGPMEDGRHVLLLVVNHSILEARSFIPISFELLTILNGSEAALPPAVVDAVLPSMERTLFNCDVYEGPPPRLNDPWCVLGRMLPISFSDDHVGSGMTRVLPLAFDGETSKRLLDQSRAHAVKLTSTISCISAMALVQLLRSHGDPIPADLQFLTAVCLRSSMNIGLNQLGCQLTAIPCRASTECLLLDSLAAFWQTAKFTNDKLHQRLDDGEALECAKTESLECTAFLEGHAFTENAHFYMSSVGAYVYESRDEADVALDDVHFMISLHETSWTPPLFHGVMSLNGRLLWDIVFHDKALQSTLATEYRSLISQLVLWISLESPSSEQTQ